MMSLRAVGSLAEHLEPRVTVEHPAHPTPVTHGAADRDDTDRLRRETKSLPDE
ncbi:hypothetical protein [Actinoplanes sp. NPDC049265]|uniref:hypothetical protein n=1 Tax=Actinoplanes sp. NPDC049265 TaxID=3363902 RepID=UPI0037110B0B